MSTAFRVVFCDLDGTLLTDTKEVLPEVITSIHKARNNGVLFVPVSARLPSGIYPILKTINLRSPIVAFGGALILDEKGNVLFEEGIERDTVKEIEEFSESIKTSAALNFYTQSNWYTDKPNHPLEKLEVRFIGRAPIEAKVIEVLREDAIVNKCMFIGEPDEIERIEPLFVKKFPNLKIVKSHPTLLEIMNEKTSKARGIDKICQFYDIPIGVTVGIGDNYNDLEMLDAVSFSVLMDNAPEDLKNRGWDYIAPDNNSGGVAKAIEKFFL